MTPTPLDSVLQHLRSEPSRTWSIVVTLFGDAVVPRGGSLWLGSLLEICAAMDIGSGVVRTAMSRLAADGWLERNRVGRNSYYSPGERARHGFARASQKIYGAPPRNWDNSLRLVLASNGADREAARAALETAGFGMVQPGLWLAAPGAEMPPEAAGLMHIDGTMDLDTGRRLSAQAWPMARLADAYMRFLDAFGPLRDSIAAGGVPGDLDALLGRILLVHQYRRVVLRDPLLPDPLLPADWPGTAARHLCSTVYAAVLPGSERWLDQYARAEAGPLPPPSVDLSLRFAARDIAGA